MAEMERIRQNNATLQTQNEILQGDIKKYISTLKKKRRGVKNVWIPDCRKYLFIWTTKILVLSIN